jgi:cell fate regulator YaaT (PSP1 superfamily)
MDAWVVEFKGNRLEHHSVSGNLELAERDFVITSCERGHDMGRLLRFDVGLREEQLCLGREGLERTILRKATEEDSDRYKSNREMERDAFLSTRERIAGLGLEMKLVDVEFQWDVSKITFYFTAEHRVDFRALVKDLAAHYRTRIELRQIGARDEAKRIGGYGVCGLKQCCTTFLKSFTPITTQMARDQGLSLNPNKISGNCGRLLCCLMYEHGHYCNCEKAYPAVGEEYGTERGAGRVVKINIFSEEMSVLLESGDVQVVTLADIRRRQREEEGLFERIERLRR